VGLLDIITGRRKLDKPAPDRLFAISTCNVLFETQLAIKSRGTAALVFQSIANADFSGIVREAEEVVRSQAADSGTVVETSEDPYGYSWLILRGSDFDELVAGINAVASSIEAGGYGERLLCAVFAFQDERSRPLYWIYNYKRGAFYPFVPAGGTGGVSYPGGAGGLAGPAGAQKRDNERELQLKAQVGAELPIEPELERWFPLWGIPI
jgi:hypothetical protein